MDRYLEMRNAPDTQEVDLSFKGRQELPLCFFCTFTAVGPDHPADLMALFCFLVSPVFSWGSSVKLTLKLL